MLLETKDIQSLFSYIKELHPHCPAEKIPKLTHAVAHTWIEGLSGYSMEQLFKAARLHASACRYWPSLAEIMKQLPPIPEGERRRYAPATPEELQHMAKWRAWQEQWHRELREAGLPTLHEAVAAGATPGEWARELIAAGAFEGGQAHDKAR